MRDNNPDRLDDGARAEAEMKERNQPQECATEGCSRAASVYFQSGGIGSHHCCDCYLKIQALPAPQGDDGLVAELVEYAECEDHYASTFAVPNHVKANIAHNNAALMRKAADALRARASEIERWAKNALDNDDSRLAAESRLASAMEALEPFARIANEVFRDDMNEHRRDDDGVWGFDNETLTFGALRRARTTLSNLKGSAE